MARMKIELDVDKRKTRVHHDGLGKFGKISIQNLKMGEIKKIEHATIIYHKSNPTLQNCVTHWLNGIPYRICSPKTNP